MGEGDETMTEGGIACWCATGDLRLREATPGGALSEKEEKAFEGMKHTWNEL